MYTVSEKDMLLTMIAYLETEGLNELAAILQVSNFVYDPKWEFSGIVSYQKKLYGSLRVPVAFKKKIEEKKEQLSEISSKIYQNDDEYYYCGIGVIGIKPIQTEEINVSGKSIIFEKDSVYSNAIKFVMDNTELSELQKQYLYEACECGDKNNLLAATVMLGASAEMMLIEMCEAYKKYLENTSSAEAVSAFERKVINAKCANDRLTEFLKRAKSNASVFNKLGFENIELNFAFLDIIRKTRNDSGHPTGNTVDQEQFKMLIANYQAILPKMLRAIKLLPTLS